MRTAVAIYHTSALHAPLKWCCRCLSLACLYCTKTSPSLPLAIRKTQTSAIIMFSIGEEGEGVRNKKEKVGASSDYIQLLTISRQVCILIQSYSASHCILFLWIIWEAVRPPHKCQTPNKQIPKLQTNEPSWNTQCLCLVQSSHHSLSQVIPACSTAGACTRCIFVHFSMSSCTSNMGNVWGSVQCKVLCGS